MAKECPLSVAVLEGRFFHLFKAGVLPSICLHLQDWASAVWTGCVVCQSVKDGGFGQFPLAHVQCSKGNERGGGGGGGREKKREKNGAMDAH